MHIKIKSSDNTILDYRYTLHELADGFTEDSEGLITYTMESGTEWIETNTISEVGEIENKFASHVTTDPSVGTTFHLKWDSTNKKIVNDDDSLAARQLSDEWKDIRAERTKRLAETDWVVIKARENGGTVPAKWKTYRVALRDLPAEQSAKTKYSDITWPTQPS